MSKRKRVSKEQTKANAEKGGRGGNDWFKLPDGVGRWIPEKAGRFSINVLPYEVAIKNHPDDVEKECLWYKLPFMVHHGVGAANESVVCPRSLGKPCCICDERDRLYKEDSDKNEDIIQALKPQKFVAYNIKSQEDEDRVDIMHLSRGKFATTLEGELKDPDNEEHLAFFDVNENGRTLRVRFSDASFTNSKGVTAKYLEATKIDFRQRDEMDEDTVLNKTVCLEEALIIMEHDALKKMFLQEDDDADGDDDKPEEKPPESKPKDDDDDDDDDEPKEKPSEPDPKPKDDDDEPKDEPAKEPELTCPQCDEDFEEEDAEHSKKLDTDFCSKKCLKKAEKAAKEKDDDEPEAKPAEGKKCKACKGTGKSSKGKKCAPCEGTGRLKEDDDEPEAKPAKTEKPADKEGEASKTKKGDKDKSDKPKCPHDGGTFGEVDQYDECDDCPHWNDCEEASE